MKTKIALATACLAISSAGFAQDQTPLTLDQAIKLALTQSKVAQAATTKTLAKTTEVGIARNKMLPEITLTGQLSYISTPDVDFKIQTGSNEQAASITTNQMYVGMANLKLPLYAGGKIRHGIRLAENALLAEEYAAATTKEQVAQQAIQLYLALYKAQQTQKVLQENIKRSTQQVRDFQAMEENGLIARNDLLKAQLQLSNYELALQEATKNVQVVNYQLHTLIGRKPLENVAPVQLATPEMDSQYADVSTAYQQRNEMKMVEAQQAMAKEAVHIAQGNYLPQLALTGGYNAFGLKDIVTVNNAMTIGVGLSYDVSALFKNGKEVKLAKTHVQEAEEQMALLQDQISVEVFQANADFELAKNQLTVYQQALEQAQENYRIVKDKYDNGIADTDDLLEADVQKVQSEINIAVAQAGIWDKYYQLLIANGQLTSNLTN